MARHTAAHPYLHQPRHLPRHADRHQRRWTDEHLPADRHLRYRPTASNPAAGAQAPAPRWTSTRPLDRDAGGDITDYSWDFGDGTHRRHPATSTRHPRLRRPRPLQRHADGHRRPRRSRARRTQHGHGRRRADGIVLGLHRPHRPHGRLRCRRLDRFPRARSPTTAGTSATAPPAQRTTRPTTTPTPTAAPTPSRSPSPTTPDRPTRSSRRHRRRPPTASFTPSAIAQPPPARRSTFDATASTAAGGTIADYSWDFGDGTASTDTGASADSHTYADPGHYTVTLTVTDDLGVTSTTARTVTIDQPTASFTAPPTVVAPNSPASFDASGSTDPAGSITDYSWDFGDGSADGRPARPRPTPTPPRHRITSRSRSPTTAARPTPVSTTSIGRHRADRGVHRARRRPGPASPVSFDAQRLDGRRTAQSPPTAGTSATAARGTGATPNHTYSTPRALHGHAHGHRRPRRARARRTHTVTVDAAPSAVVLGLAQSGDPGPRSRFDAQRLERLARHDHRLQLGFRRRRHRLRRHRQPRLPAPGQLHGHADRHQRRRTDRDASATRSPSTPRRPPSFSVVPERTRPARQSRSTPAARATRVGTIVDYSWNFGDGARPAG